MSTRGVYGFIKNGVEKIGYNHCDSYICELGANIAKFISETTKEEMKEIFEKIILVDDNTEVTDEQIKKCEKWFQPMGYGEKSWYNLLRSAQGNLDLYKDGELEYMFNGENMDVEYKYVINLDNNEFEIYETDFETEEMKVIKIYPLDKVNESDVQALYKIRLEEEKKRALAKKEEEIFEKEEKERVLLEKIEELSQDEEFMRYYHSELSSNRVKEDYVEFYMKFVMAGLIHIEELDNITDAKEREGILLKKINEMHEKEMMRSCISKYTGIEL